MKRSSDKHTVLRGGDFTLASNPDTARMTYDLTDHMFCRMAMAALLQGLDIHLAAADRPFCYIIRPDVRRYRGRGLAKPVKK